MDALHRRHQLHQDSSSHCKLMLLLKLLQRLLLLLLECRQLMRLHCCHHKLPCQQH